MRRYFQFGDMVYSLAEEEFDGFQKKLRAIRYTSLQQSSLMNSLAVLRNEIIAKAQFHFRIDSEFNLGL